MPTKARITLRQLAEELELSPATVSRALNGFPEVGARTRKRVFEVAEKMGYQPDRYAKRLAEGTSNSIGIIINAESGRNIEPLFSEFFAGVTEYATEINFDLLITPTTTANELREYEKLSAQRAVDGFIISTPRLSDPRIIRLNELKVPYVAHGRTNASFKYNWLDIDNRGGFKKATQLFIDYGHKDIVWIGDYFTEATFAEHRYQGYCQAMKENGIKLRKDLVIQQRMTVASAYQNTKKLFKLSRPPTAFLCSSIFIAIGVIRAANELKLSCPEDFSIISHDDRLHYIEAEHFSPPMTTIQSPIRSAGKRCAEIIYKISRKNHSGYITEEWPVDLILRDSVGFA